MAAPNANALFLLADHIKLSLVERQRTKKALLDDDDDEQDGHISRSLDQFRSGIDALQQEQSQLDEDDTKAIAIADALPSLQKQYESLVAQFQRSASTSPSKQQPTPSSSSSPSSASSASTPTPASQPKKAVRFQDKPLPKYPPSSDDDDDEAAARNSKNRNDSFAVDLEAQRRLFNGRYRDDPQSDNANNVDRVNSSNPELLQTHANIIADQDAQLDALGASISRQRELSMLIGDELDSHVAMLEESERLTDRHQSRLDRARGQVGRLTRNAGDCKQMGIIVTLIVILVLLIAILK